MKDFTGKKNWTENFEDKEYMELLNGKYVINSVSNSGFITYILQNVLPKDNGDFEIIVNLRRVDGKDNYAYGIMFGIDRSTDYHIFRIADIGYYRYDRLINDRIVKVIDWKKSASVNNSMNNELRIKRFGENLQFYINGYLVDEIEALDNYFGSIGFIVSDEMTIEIEDVVVVCEKEEPRTKE